MEGSARLQHSGDLTSKSSRDSQGLPESLAQNSLEFLENYARERPISLALWALGIGFVLGWKLKPW